MYCDTWSSTYFSPAGVEGEPCRHHVMMRQRIGPYSRSKTFMILVGSCGWCGRIVRSYEDLSWQQYIWVRRLNQREDHEKSFVVDGSSFVVGWLF